LDTTILLLEEDKRVLVDEILRLRQRVKELTEELEHLKEKSPSHPAKPDYKFKKRSKPPSQWGRKTGHPGCTRPKPDHIDREVEQTLKRCPDCQGHLSASVGVVEHIQEDIVPSRVEVTRFKRHRYWCRHCKKMMEAPYAADEVPCGYLGPVTLVQMAMLKYYHGLPGNKIVKLFDVFCGLKVSEGAIAQALQRMGKWLSVEAQTIQAAIRSSAYLHVDETGWKINGTNHWLWAFVNQKLAYYRIDRSRGSKVPKDVLGNPFPGILISDFYSAYNKLNCRQQKCLVHLLREMRDCRGKDPPEDFKAPCKKLKRILSDAHRLQKRQGQMSRLTFVRKVRQLKDRLFLFATTPYSNKNWQRLSARCLKHEKKMLTFLDFPGLPSNNNHAERMIRPHVILRNRWFQNRTDKGSTAHSVMTSILHSLLLQKQSPIPAFSRAYLAHRQGRTRPLLFTSKTTSIG
jgi:transposase